MDLYRRVRVGTRVMVLPDRRGLIGAGPGHATRQRIGTGGPTQSPPSAMAR
jgi:hypothetical protein